MFKSTWTDAEIDMLAHHKVPPGRSLNGARAKAWSLHSPFRPSDPNAQASETPDWKPQRRSWTADDVGRLKGREVPAGRTLKTARSIAHRLHIPFNRIRKQKTPQKEKVALLKDQIVEELLTTRNIRATARKFGLSYTPVRNIALEINL